MTNKLVLTAHDPIVIQIGEKEYSIEAISSRLLSDFQEAASTFEVEPTKIRAEEIGHILTKMLPTMSLEEAMDLDIRHVTSIVEFISEQVAKAVNPENEKN